MVSKEGREPMTFEFRDEEYAMPQAEVAAKATRIETLVNRSSDLSNTGDFQGAANALREALHIDPGNPRIKEQLIKLRDSDVGKNAFGLLEDYLRFGGADTGKKAAAAASRASKDDVDKILTRLLDDENDAKKRDLLSKVVSAVVHSEAGQVWIARRLSERPTETFSKVWARGGDDAVKALVASLLKPGNWTSEAQRGQAETDVFKILMAKLIEAGVEADQKEICMGGLARLLAVDAPKLVDCIDRDTFDILFTALDVRNNDTLRSQATLAMVKVLEARQDDGKKMLKDLVVSRIARQTDDDLTIAFSAAAAVFPILPERAAEMFLAPGFVQDLVRLAGAGKDEKEETSLRQAALELLSAACVVKQCREAVAKDCVGWLRQLSKGDGQDASMAALVLSKLELPESQSKKDIDNLLPKLKSMAIDSSKSDPNQHSIEALAYRSIQPKVKENLATDRAFLKSLFGSSPSGPSLYATLTILNNLSAYLPILSPDQKRYAQLKAYANQSKPAEPDPLNSDASVDVRCKALLDADVASFIIKTIKPHSVDASSSSGSRITPGHLDLIAQIILSLSRNPKTRGSMVQNRLFDVAVIASGDDLITSNSPITKRRACLAVARMLEATDPSLIFQSQQRSRSILPTLDALKYLIELPVNAETRDSPDAISDDSDREYWSGYPVNCGLRAMTNMVTLEYASGELSDRVPGFVSKQVFSTLWKSIEDGDIPERSDASMELICNLCHSEVGCQKVLGGYRDSNSIADAHGNGSNLLHISHSFASSPSTKTRLAAGGCLHALLAMGSPRALQLFLTLNQGDPLQNVLQTIAECTDLLYGRLGQWSKAKTFATDPRTPEERRRHVDDLLKRAFAIIDVCLQFENDVVAGKEGGDGDGGPVAEGKASVEAHRMFFRCGVKEKLGEVKEVLLKADKYTKFGQTTKEMMREYNQLADLAGALVKELEGWEKEQGR